MTDNIRDNTKYSIVPRDESTSVSYSTIMFGSLRDQQ